MSAPLAPPLRATEPPSVDRSLSPAGSGSVAPVVEVDAPRGEAAPGRRGAATVVRWEVALYAILAVLVLVLGLARLRTGPWFQTNNPYEGSLLNGFPVGWEAVYYTDQFPTFAGNGHPSFGFSPVHTRTFLTLQLAAGLYAWTGNAFWSLAAVDFVFWFLGGIAAYHLALRLGAGRWPSALTALLVTTSPLMISHLWRDDLHPANFASMTLGSWAALVLIDEPRPRWQLAAGLSLLLVFLSLSYQYQWIMVPLLVILVATQPRLGLRRGLPAVAAAVAVYLVSTIVVRDFLAWSVGPATTWLGAATQPGPLILQRMLGVRSMPDLLAVLPHSWDYAQLSQAFQPIVFCAAIVGMLRRGLRLPALVVVGLAVSLFSITYYSAPWAATNNYPFVYAAAALAFTACGTGAATVLRRLVPGREPLAAAARYAVSLGWVVVCAAITNADLWGDPTFLLRWWRFFSGRYIF